MIRALPILASSALGLATAVGAYTFVYAKGYSYLTNDPAACANCHVMQNHFDDWLRSSHRAVAACNDCHTPPGLIPKYVTKARNGLHHSVAFTTQRFHEPIRITDLDREVVEQACSHCHEDIVLAIEGPHGESGRLACVRCHSTVGHLE